MMAKVVKKGMVAKLDFERLAADMLQLPQAELNLQHLFAPGIYMRMITVPAGAIILGHEHKTEYFNIVMSGSASVLMDGKVVEVKAPCIIKSAVGTQKLAYATEEMIWVTVHATEETDIDKIEEQLIVKSKALERHKARLERARQQERKQIWQQQ